MATGTLLLGALVPAQAAEAAAPRGEAVFNTPGGSQIVDRLNTLIRGAAPGSEILIAINSFNDDAVRVELARAARRGVKVKVIADYTASRDNGPFKRLTRDLGSDTSKKSWTYMCPPTTQGSACIGNVRTPINHNKFFLFSNTGGARNVVVQSTANLNSSLGGRGGWNSAVTLAGAPRLYQAYRGYFVDLFRHRKNANYFRQRPPVKTDAGKVYFFPRQDGDTIVNVLKDVSCRGGTNVRVAMWHFARDNVARQLWRLDNAGCRVQVVLNETDGGGVLSILRKPGRNGGPEVKTFSDKNKGVHSKYLSIEGPRGQLVYMGSHNYTPAGLQENDETLLKLYSPALHEQFKRNFDQVFAAADRVLV